MPKTNSKRKIEVVKGFRVNSNIKQRNQLYSCKPTAKLSHIIKEAAIEWIRKT